MDQNFTFPGKSVLLRDDPKGPVMTVLAVRIEGLSRMCKVVWLDIMGQRREAEFQESQLKLA